jgi:uncharacterized protein (TIGR02284 family)
MKSTSEKCDKAIRELIIINHDRTEGYARAAEEANDNDLRIIFTRFSTQSKTFSNQLKDFVGDWDNLPEDDKTKLSGKLYRVWMDMKAAIAGNNRKAVLNSCEFGEDVAKKTYDDILNDPEDIPADAMAVIRQQRMALQEGHDMIKSMRDRAA